MRAQFKARIRLVLAGVVLFALLITIRLYFVQIVDGEKYAEKADRQFSSGNTGLFDRGAIFFTRKDGTPISAATLSSGFLIAINPQTLSDPEAAYAAVSEAASSTQVSREAFLSAAERRQQVHVEVAHRVSEEAGKELSKKGIPGVEVLRERWRLYPAGALAAQSVGIVSYGSEDTLAGRTGLEAQYDETLSRSGDGLYRNFFAELFSNVGNLLVDARSAREGDVITTIEPEVQVRLAEEVAALSARYGSKESGGIIMDPKTGEILALASVPSFDPNNLISARPTLLTNPLVEHVYEFGSIVKPLTVASALDAGVVTSRSTYNDTGCIVVDGARLCNWDGKARGVTPLAEVILQSLNVGAAWVAGELGQEGLRSYFLALFGQRTEADLPLETNSLLGNLNKSQQVGYMTAAYGQGIAVSPLQMVRALGALANDGKMVRPHLGRAIALETGATRTLDWSGDTSVFSAGAAQEVTRMMVQVVDEKLQNGGAKIPTMSVAGKTGTAQLASPGGGYYTDRFFHSFVGFFPASNPRYIILLYTNDPQGVQYASETLVPTFLDLVHFLIDYYAVPPDRLAA